MKNIVCGSLILLLVGCSSKVLTKNQLVSNDSALPPYSISESINKRNEGDISVSLAFSGGGIRAAALAYGTLLALRETQIKTESGSQTMLNEVDYINSVSGGTFTTAYYGLYGDKIFKDFEKDVLYKDIGGDLFSMLLSPSLWFSESSRTDKAVEYYQKEVFHGATFADLQRSDGPMVIINATDLGAGVRFSFIQEYFDLICSDLHSYPVADAVTASSAVPIMFNPVVLENHADCPPNQLFTLDRESDDAQIQHTIEGLRSYQDKKKRKYIHLVDGGISDNLGLLAIYDVVEGAGGGERFFEITNTRALSHFVIIVVDASTTPERHFEGTTDEPSISDTFDAMTDIQLHRYNDATKSLMKQKMPQWAEMASSPELTPKPFFIDINLQSLTDPSKHQQINAIPTDLTLDKESVTMLIEEGRQQLLKNKQFIELVKQLQ